jgi:hypothetical protein
MQTLNLDDLDGASDNPRPSFSGQAAANTDPTSAAAWCLAQHTEHHGPAPAPGEKHNIWLAAFVKFCNASGAYLSDVLALALDTAPPGHDMAKIEATVKGIYRRDAATHGSKPYTAPRTSGGNNTGAAGSTRKGSPTPPPDTFPATVYDALPDYLRRCCAPFDGHEKAVMLLGALAVLSGCFPAVGGEYNRRRFGLNLFAFLIAPAASGKGTLAWARRLAWPWHKRLTDESRAAHADYEAELAAHRAATKGKGTTATPPPAGPPPHKLLYLPGNTTAAALATALAENDGRGIMCETEADTLTGALGADFGNFSDVLRKSFQHEPVSLLRKTDRQHLDLAHPALSIALTGTPGQLPRLMPTAEDGLVSRFLFYTFEQAPIWQDVSPAAGPALTPIIEALADELTRMIEAAPAAEEPGRYPVEISLAPADWHRLNAAGQAGLGEAAAAAGGAGASTAFRLGLIAWRVAGLLTVLRCYENGEALTGCLLADSADVSTALAIMDTARAHALAVLAMLPTPGGRVSNKFAAKAGQQERVHELHAQGLSYREIAEQVGVSFSTVGNWLKNV